MPPWYTTSSSTVESLLEVFPNANYFQSKFNLQKWKNDTKYLELVSSACLRYDPQYF